MPLDWSDTDGLAAALLARHPDQDRLALDHETLRRLVLALDHFTGAPTPPAPRYLDALLWRWMRLAHGDGAGA